MIRPPFIPVWESHMAQREDSYTPGPPRPHWLIHADTILRLRSNPSYEEYIIETRDKLVYFTRKDIWERLVNGEDPAELP
jgi:hypothetical protein